MSRVYFFLVELFILFVRLILSIPWTLENTRHEETGKYHTSWISISRDVASWNIFGFIVINEIYQISRNWLRQGIKFRKLQETIWISAINKMFKFPPHLDNFGYINYLYELLWGYPNYPIQKWHIWASFQASRKEFRKLQEAIWVTAINEVFKFPPHFKLFGQVNYLYELSSGYQNHATQK